MKLEDLLEAQTKQEKGKVAYGQDFANICNSLKYSIKLSSGKEVQELDPLTGKKVRPFDFQIRLPEVTNLAYVAKVIKDVKLYDLAKKCAYAQNYDERRPYEKQIMAKVPFIVKWVRNNIWKYTLSKDAMPRVHIHGNKYQVTYLTGETYIKFFFENNRWILVSFHDSEFSKKAKYKGDQSSYKINRNLY